MGRWNAAANSVCVIPRRPRNILTRDTRRIPAKRPRPSGRASGSDRAAAEISSSVMAFKRDQSVPPLRGASPGFTVTRVVSVFFMTCGLPGRYDSTGILTALRNHDEQHVTLSHTDYPRPLFALFGFEVYILKPIGVFQSRNGIDKIDAMFAIVQAGFCVVPFVSHSPAYYRISVVEANFGFLGIDRREKPFCLRLPNFRLRSPHERQRHAGLLASPRVRCVPLLIREIGRVQKGLYGVISRCR